MRKRDDWATWLLPPPPAPTNTGVRSEKDEPSNEEVSQQGLPSTTSKSVDEGKVRGDESSGSVVNQSETSASSLESGAESRPAAKGGMDKLNGDVRVNRLDFMSVLQKACSGC